MGPDRLRSVRTAMEVRVTLTNRVGEISRVFEVLRRHGGDVHAHLVYVFGDKLVGLFVCERPTAGALALEDECFSVETQTVVVVCTERDRGASGHLVHTLEEERIAVAYTYATGTGDDLVVVLRTADDAAAEDVLKNYLDLPIGGFDA